MRCAQGLDADVESWFGQVSWLKSERVSEREQGKVNKRSKFENHNNNNNSTRATKTTKAPPKTPPPNRKNKVDGEFALCCATLLDADRESTPVFVDMIKHQIATFLMCVRKKSPKTSKIYCQHDMD